MLSASPKLKMARIRKALTNNFSRGISNNSGWLWRRNSRKATCDYLLVVRLRGWPARQAKHNICNFVPVTLNNGSCACKENKGKLRI
jgi:hypothetical protein